MTFGNNPKDNAATPLGSVYVPNTANSDLTTLEGILINTDGNGQKSSGARMGLKDGDDVTQGLIADAAVTGDNSGTLSAKLRGLLKILTATISPDQFNTTLFAHLAQLTGYVGGMPDSTGLPQQPFQQRISLLEGKSKATGTVTSTLATDINVVFSVAPKTLEPGRPILLTGGATPEVAIVADSFTPSVAATTIPLRNALVQAGNTTAAWDQFAALGPAGNAITPFGIQPVALTFFDSSSSTGNFKQLQGASAGDGQSSSNFPEFALGYWNGAQIDRARGNLDNLSLIASAAYTTTQTSADQINYNGRGVIVTLDTTVASTGSVTLEIDMKDPVSGKYVALLTGAAVTTAVTNIYQLYPGVTAAANAAVSSPLPRTWRVKVIAGNANAQTYSVGASVIV